MTRGILMKDRPAFFISLVESLRTTPGTPSTSSEVPFHLQANVACEIYELELRGPGFLPNYSDAKDQGNSAICQRADVMPNISSAAASAAERLPNQSSKENVGSSRAVYARMKPSPGSYSIVTSRVMRRAGAGDGATDPAGNQADCVSSEYS